MKIVMKTSSLQEVLSDIFGNSMLEGFYEDLSYDLKNYLDNEVPNGLHSSAIKFATYADDEFTYKDYIEEMLVEFYNRYYNWNAVAYYDSNKTQEEKSFMIRFLNALNITYPVYAKLIKLYKDDEANLMAKLERSYTDLAGNTGSSTNRFNDTPQDGGAFADDNHTTNINEINSSTSSNLRHNETYTNAEMIDRLNKINDGLRNLYLEWENKVARILWLKGVC